MKPPAGLVLGLGLSLLALLARPGAAADTPPTNAAPATRLVVVVGAAGQEEYGRQFASSAQLWLKAGAAAQARCTLIGQTPTNGLTDLGRLQQTLASEPKQSLAPLWLVLLGHGTSDGTQAKFNLRGPDLAATNLAAWLQPFQRPLVVIDCSSASAPFLARLSAPGRVIITATRSGFEQNYSRFGQYLAAAINDPQADLDKDGQTSLLEAFLMASRQVAEFYRTAGRLATEHALLDDNGDKLGTPADWFRGVVPVKRAREGAALDGLRAQQLCLVPSAAEQQLSPALRARRDELELAIAQLRERKTKLAEDDYYRQLEALALELARISATNTPPLPAATTP